ncbi:hypothetical protein BDZ94DRAFT_1177483 [Collybia nuda]|uniref:Uncharacterized protein n=1 Tax=Collybia nuda TaxID=64659 RepID=A0A9P5XTP6_9AGAR|nr:hypothetical protein BDZ94DRAFT_1177483 [Collybia nuda]
MEAIRGCIKTVLLPTWVHRPPINLGEPSHGKLKAQDYLILFTYIFPLIIPQIWYTPTASETDQEHFHCFYHLVAATNIVSSFKVSNADADAYTQYYIQYRAAIQKLFPYCPSKPNHHYAMHNAAQMKYWGPLPSFSEFPGEKMNGMLQNIKTNRRLRDLDYTMLRQMTCRAHINAALHDVDGPKELANILEPTDVSVDASPVALKPSEVASVLAKATNLQETEYNALLHYLQNTGQPYRSYDDFPHPPNALILPPMAQKPLQFNHGEQTFSCEHSHQGNSAIQFYNPLVQANSTGFIQSIWMLPLDGLMHTFIVVRPHLSLSSQEEAQASFIHYPGFLAHIVDLQPSADLVIVEQNHIITHLTGFKLPARTYGINKETLVVCQALNCRHW